MIEAKAAGQTVAAAPVADSSARVVDLMAALEASVKAAKERRAADEAPAAPAKARAKAPAGADEADAEAKPAKTRRRKSA